MKKNETSFQSVEKSNQSEDDKKRQRNAQKEILKETELYKKNIILKVSIIVILDLII